MFFNNRCAMGILNTYLLSKCCSYSLAVIISRFIIIFQLLFLKLKLCLQCQHHIDLRFSFVNFYIINCFITLDFMHLYNTLGRHILPTFSYWSSHLTLIMLVSNSVSFFTSIYIYKN